MVSVIDGAQEDCLRDPSDRSTEVENDRDGPSPPAGQVIDSERMVEEDEDVGMIEDVGEEASDDGDSSDAHSSNSGGKRPHHTFMNLIAMAIMSSERKMMVLPEIYEYIQKNFPFYGEDNKRGWQNAVRHNLSLHDCFVKVPRYKVDAPTTSCYWRLSDEARDLYDRGESLKRKGAYRRKGGPRGLCYRGPALTGTVGGDPYAKQHLYSSSWKIRQPPNGGYSLRLEPRSVAQPTMRSVSSSSSARPVSAASLDWQRSRAGYGFAGTPDRHVARSIVAAPPHSSRYEKHYAARYRDEHHAEASSRQDVAPHPVSQSSYEQYNRRQALSYDTAPEAGYGHSSHRRLRSRPEHETPRSANTGRLTFDSRAGLRRIARDHQGRLCQVETFRSDQWRYASYDRRGREAILAHYGHSEMIKELAHDVQEAYDAVVSAMNAVLVMSGDARKALERPVEQSRQQRYYHPYATVVDTTRYGHDPAGQRQVDRHDVAGERTYYMSAVNVR